MKLLKTLFLSASIGAFAQMSYAMPIVQTAACVNDASALCATGATGVYVQGRNFNVLFSQESYDTLFGAPPNSFGTPTFYGNEEGAVEALSALRHAFNAAGIRGLIGDPTVGGGLFVPTDDYIGGYVLHASTYYRTGTDFSDVVIRDGTPVFDPLYANNPARFDAYALFKEVPSPPVVALFGLGLAGLGLRRKGKTSE